MPGPVGTRGSDHEALSGSFPAVVYSVPRLRGVLMSAMTTRDEREQIPKQTGERILGVTHLQKSFGSLKAVDDLSLEITAGQTYGLLGPNGAGKTTAISMVVGIMEPDAGHILIEGVPITPRTVEVKGRLGYVPQDVAVYPDLTARENLRLFARLYAMSKPEARRRSDEVLTTIGLEDRADESVKKYSGGMKRRLNIGIGLLHRPTLLILDEPTVGVDPQSRNAILESVEKLSEEGMAVLYTTHYMEEAQRLCDRVGIIDHGKLIAEGTTRELVEMVGERDHVTVSVTGQLARAARACKLIPAVQEVTVREGTLDLIVDNARTALQVILDEVVTCGATVRSVSVTEPDLEAVFLHLTGKSLRD
jgi:ABC-2 type transport system ATP-binding protein